MALSMPLLALSLALIGDAPAPAWPADALMLVVAGWCAPCHGEIDRLDAIAEAADGRAIKVVGFDQSAGTRAMLARVPPARRWQLSPSDEAALRQAVYAVSAGLPYAVVTDAAGRRCADATRPLTAARARALVARCGR